MASMSPDLDVLKDLPGYKAILKTVVKSLIQLLLEQLSEHTAEESLILTASINDGSLSHLGSTLGKGFLDGREEIKSQFLGYCLKAQQKRLYDSQTTRATHSPILGHQTIGDSYHVKRPKPYDRLPLDQSYQGTSKHKRKRERIPEGGHFGLTDNVPDGSFLPSMETSLSRAVFPSHINKSFQGDGSPGHHSDTNTKTEKSADIDLSHSNMGSSVKHEPAELDSDIELTGVEEGKPAIHFSQIGHQSSAQIQNYECLLNKIESSTDLAGPFQNHLDNGIMGEREFTCDICMKGFRCKQNLERHYRIHTGHKPFPCKYCEKSFRMKHHLQGHVASSHAGFIPDFLKLSGKL